MLENFNGKNKPFTKYDGVPSKYDESFPQIAYEILSRGETLAAVCCELDISYETLSQWRNASGKYYKPELSEAIKKGLMLSLRHWESEGDRMMYTDKGFRDTLYIFKMKKQFWQFYGDHVGSDASMAIAPQGDGKIEGLDETKI